MKFGKRKIVKNENKFYLLPIGVVSEKYQFKINKISKHLKE